MRRFALLTLTLAAMLLAVSTTQAGSWVFRRSYYSHQPASPVRIGRPATGGPFYSRPQGGYFTGGYRYSRSTISIQGQIFDNLIQIESWGQTGSQY